MTNYGLNPEDQDALRATATGSTATPRFAGWWIRVGAYLIDSIVLAIGFFIILIIGNVIGGVAGIVILVVALIVWLLGYWVYYEGSESGQTLGKRACGIQVRSTSGGRASYGQAFGRNLVARVIGIFPIIGLIDVLWPLWDDNKQCIHDKAASTIVVYT